MHRDAPRARRLVVEHEPVHRVLQALPQRRAQRQAREQGRRRVPRGPPLGVRPRHAPGYERDPHERHDPPADHGGGAISVYATTRGDSCGCDEGDWELVALQSGGKRCSSVNALTKQGTTVLTASKYLASCS